MHVSDNGRIIPGTRRGGWTMLAEMAERIRLIIDTEEDFRLAVRLRAVKEDISPSEVINRLIAKHLAEELVDARKYAGDRRGAAAPKPGRKSKRSD